jgi:hypothetical protein
MEAVSHRHLVSSSNAFSVWRRHVTEAVACKTVAHFRHELLKRRIVTSWRLLCLHCAHKRSQQLCASKHRSRALAHLAFSCWLRHCCHRAQKLHTLQSACIKLDKLRLHVVFNAWRKVREERQVVMDSNWFASVVFHDTYTKMASFHTWRAWVCLKQNKVGNLRSLRLLLSGITEVSCRLQRKRQSGTISNLLTSIVACCDYHGPSRCGISKRGKELPHGNGLQIF